MDSLIILFGVGLLIDESMVEIVDEDVVLVKVLF